MAELVLPNLELQMLLNNKSEGFNYRSPREEPWRENYELYRDHVTVNRLIQRQSVNMPLMKTTLRTTMKDVDDMPVIEFQNLDNDLEAQLFQNDFWKLTLEINNAELQDIVDKKQDFFYGRTFDSWQIKDGQIKFDIEDSEDILVSRFMNPYDLNSSRYLIHTHIFKPLSSLIGNPDYDKESINKLVEFFKTKQGIIKAQDNENSLEQKNKKISDLGVSDINDPILGETWVELTIHYIFRTDEKYQGRQLDEQIFVYIEAENQVILMKKPQEEIIGKTKSNWWKTHYRYHTWGDDLDKQDFWTDGIADIVRTPNKVLNAWFSQLVENRTLRSMGMTFYDATKKAEGFVPNTYQPKPFGFYGLPGKPADIIQRVDIPDLSDTRDEIEMVTEMVQNATATTPTQQGVIPPAGTPLGVTQIVQAEAQARVKGLSKYYTDTWKKRGQTFLMLIEAGASKLDAVKISRKGKNTNDIFTREITPKDFQTPAGYQVKVWSQDEKNKNDTTSIQKLEALKFAMPDNPKVAEIYDRKLAEFADLKPEEVTEIMDFEKNKQAMMAMNPMNTMNPNPAQPTQVPPKPPAQMPAQMMTR